MLFVCVATRTLVWVSKFESFEHVNQDNDVDKKIRAKIWIIERIIDG